MSKDIKRVLISQPVPQNPKSPYFQMAEKLGVTFDFVPLFKVEAVSSREFRDQKIDVLAHTAVVLTSRTQVDHLFEILKELRLTLPDDFKYFCSSEVVGAYLQKYITVRKRKVFYPGKGCTKDFEELLIKNPKEYYLVPTTKELSDEDFYTMLGEKEIAYSRVILSETINAKLTKEQMESYDLVVFFSPKGIYSLQSNLPNYKQGEQRFGCLGDKTEQAIEEAGFRVDLMAPTPEFTSITAAIENYIEKHNK